MLSEFDLMRPLVLVCSLWMRKAVQAREPAAQSKGPSAISSETDFLSVESVICFFIGWNSCLLYMRAILLPNNRNDIGTLGRMPTVGI